MSSSVISEPSVKCESVSASQAVFPCMVEPSWGRSECRCRALTGTPQATLGGGTWLHNLKSDLIWVLGTSHLSPVAGGGRKGVKHKIMNPRSEPLGTEEETTETN